MESPEEFRQRSNLQLGGPKRYAGEHVCPSRPSRHHKFVGPAENSSQNSWYCPAPSYHRMEFLPRELRWPSESHWRSLNLSSVAADDSSMEPGNLLADVFRFVFG